MTGAIPPVPGLLAFHTPQYRTSPATTARRFKYGRIGKPSEGVLALIAARLAFSRFERGNELGGILMVAVTIVGAVLSLRDLNLYRRDQRTEQAEM